jgi:hypothetical protein
MRSINPTAQCIKPFIDKFNLYEKCAHFDEDYYEYICDEEFLKKKKILMITLIICPLINI